MSVENSLQEVISQIESVLNSGLDNIYINTGIKVFLGLYAAFAAPALPPKLVFLMDNVLVRIVVAFVIILMATRDPSLALIMAIAFIMTLQTANKLRLIDTSMSYSEPGESSWLPSAKENNNVNELEKDVGSDIDSDSDSDSDSDNELDKDEHEHEHEEHEQIKPLFPDTQNNLLENYDNNNTNTGVDSVTHTNTTQEPLAVPQPDTAQNPFFNNVSEHDEKTISLSRPTDNLKDKPTEPQGLLADESAAPISMLGTNEVPGADQSSCVGTFASQHCIQGLNNPGGAAEPPCCAPPRMTV